jgi:NAD(P)H-hydrate epimerase
MATGGMGDVLTGIITGLLAQGLTPWQAARTGVYLHGCAGDRAAAGGERGLLAMDLLPFLRELVNPAAP